jgi:hypothetical protein
MLEVKKMMVECSFRRNSSIKARFQVDDDNAESNDKQ